MHQIKIFKALESDLTSFEKQINSWLAGSGVKIINIFGNVAAQSMPMDEKNIAISKGAWAPSDVVVFVHYETA